MRPRLTLMLVALALVLGGCKSKPAEADTSTSAPKPAKPGRIVLPADSPKLKQLRVEPVAAADVPSAVVVAPGKIEVNPNRVARVVLPLAGRVTSVMVRLGDAVQQGQPLVLLESPDSDAAVAGHLQAQAAVTQAKSALLKATSDYERLRDLYEHSAVAKKDVLSAESTLAQSKAALEQAQALAQQSLRRLAILGLKPEGFGQKLTVRAPIAGKVLDLNVAAGEFRNDTSTGVITIADLSTVWVASDVPENAIRFIQIGERLDLELSAFPGVTFRGRVTRIADTVDPQTRTVKVRAEMGNAQGRLRPEMFGRIRHVESTQRLPVVPVGAVVQSEGATVVYKEISQGVFDPVQVTLGERIGDRIAVPKGLAPGDRIVTDGVMLLKTF